MSHPNHDVAPFELADQPVPDQHRHEHPICCHVKDHGILTVSS